MPNTISTACDFKHLIHPLSIHREKMAPSIWRRITGVALLLLSIPFTLGILTGLYLYWAHKKAVQINREQTKAIDATVQKLFGNQVGSGGPPNAQFVQTARSLYKGKTEEAFKQMKKMPADLLTLEAKKALAESTVEKNQINLIDDILKQFNDIQIPLHKAKTEAMVEKLIELGANAEDWEDDKGNTAMHYADNLEVAKALKKHGAELRCNVEGLSPLHTCKSPEVALFLVAREPEGCSMSVNWTPKSHPKVRPAIYSVPLEVKKALIKNDTENVIPLDYFLHTCEDREFAELLLSKNVDVNQKDKEGNPPLFTVENPQVLKLLIERGANVRHIDGKGRSILHLRPLPEDLLDLILEKANETVGEPSLLEIRDRSGNTPALRDTTDEWRRLLIKKGANVNDRDSHGYTLLHLCQTKAFAKFLIDSGLSVNVQSNRGNTPLHMVGKDEVITVLLERKADINILNDEGFSPLYLRPHLFLKPKMMKLLIDHGADLNIKSPYQDTLLHSTQDAEVVKILLAKGVDPNAVDENGQTPLMRALSNEACPRKTIEMLIKKSDLTIANNAKKTAFHFLLESDFDVEFFQIFLDKGADPKALDKDGNSLLSYCKNKEAAQKLIDLGVEPLQTNAVGQTAIFHSISPSTVKFLVTECGVDINQKDSQGRTPLHTCRDSTTLEWMIDEGGLDPNELDNQKQTPLHAQCLAAVGNVIPISLIDRGANVNAQDNQGRTPLHLCKTSWIADSLIEKGADKTITDHSGKTAEVLKDLSI